MRYLILLSVVISGIILPGCDAVSVTDDKQDYPIQTGNTEYTASVEDGMVEIEIPHRFTNRTLESVYIVNCNRYFAIQLQKRVGNTWIDAVAYIIPLCLSPAIEIASGDSFEHTLLIRAGLPSSGTRPRFEVEEIEGSYRLVWVDVLRSYNPGTYPFGEQIPLVRRVSNVFQIH